MLTNTVFDLFCMLYFGIENLIIVGLLTINAYCMFYKSTSYSKYLLHVAGSIGRVFIALP